MVLSIDRWKGKVAIVTGASSGIGAAIAETLVKSGITVVGLARRSDRIDKLSKKLLAEEGKLYSVKTDISKEEDILNAFKWVKDNLGPVHILVNNAGIQKATSLANGDTKKWKKTFDVNVIALCIATREAVKSMKENNIEGHIIHINSVAGHGLSRAPGLNVYGASKCAVTALVETLRQELNQMGSKIKISDVSPGPTSSEFVRKAVALAKLDPTKRAYIKTLFFLDPEDVAQAVHYVLSTPPHVQVHELILRSIAKSKKECDCN